MIQQMLLQSKPTFHGSPQQSSDYVCSIVFVHGLQGHPRTTWTCERSSTIRPQGSKQSTGNTHNGIKKLFSRTWRAESKDAQRPAADEVFWPLDLLPEDCTTSRILTWGYDSKVSHFFGGAVNQSNITAHARNLLHALKIRRLDCVSSSNCVHILLLRFWVARKKPHFRSTFPWW
jgi:hypothetical protein